MTGFEPRTSGVRSKRVTTTAMDQKFLSFVKVKMRKDDINKVLRID